MEGRQGGVAARLLGVAFVFTILSTPACSRRREASAEPPLPVHVAIAAIEAVPIEIRAMGTVHASSSVAVEPRVTGLIIAIDFEEGRDVNAGDVLFRLDRRPFEAALREASSNLAKSEAQASNAAEEATRYEQLVAAGVASRQDAAQRRSAARAAKAAVDADRATLASRRLELEYTTIRAPIGGRTGSILVGSGNLVRANETHLVDIRRISPAQVTFSIPAASLGEVRRRAANERLRLSATPSGAPSGEPSGEAGVLTFFDSTISPATGTVELHGTFENASKVLWPGQFVDVTMSLGVREGAVVVPSAAVQTGPNGDYVLVVGAEDTVEMRPVTPGIRTLGGRVVLDNGLSAGERVVTEGQLRLVPGAKVVILPDVAGGKERDGGARR